MGVGKQSDGMGLWMRWGSAGEHIGGRRRGDKSAEYTAGQEKGGGCKALCLHL